MPDHGRLNLQKRTCLRAFGRGCRRVRRIAIVADGRTDLAYLLYQRRQLIRECAASRQTRPNRAHKPGMLS